MTGPSRVVEWILRLIALQLVTPMVLFLSPGYPWIVLILLMVCHPRPVCFPFTYKPPFPVPTHPPPVPTVQIHTANVTCLHLADGLCIAGGAAGLSSPSHCISTGFHANPWPLMPRRRSRERHLDEHVAARAAAASSRRAYHSRVADTCSVTRPW